MNSFRRSQLVIALSLALVPTVALVMGCTNDKKADVVAAHASEPSPKAVTRTAPIVPAAAAPNTPAAQRAADAPADGGKDGGYVHGDGGKDGGYVQDHHDGGKDGGTDKDGGQ
ncbi:MAG: hypothetical protein FWD69_00255 [Polyangiaceae bacterium]|nr:hypothetical protein [Polyangiaceae bacterium]